MPSLVDYNVRVKLVLMGFLCSLEASDVLIMMSLLFFLLFMFESYYIMPVHYLVSSQDSEIHIVDKLLTDGISRQFHVMTERKIEERMILIVQ